MSLKKSGLKGDLLEVEGRVLMVGLDTIDDRGRKVDYRNVRHESCVRMRIKLRFSTCSLLSKFHPLSTGA